jgi:hypothetical protein
VAETRLRELQRARVQETASALGDLAGSTAAAFTFASQQMAESGQKGAVAMFRASQVASVAQIGFAVAEGIARVASIAATRPALAAIAGAGLAVAQGTALAMVAAQKPPQVQTFDTGGQVMASAAVAPMTATREQVQVRAVPGEVVVDAATSRDLGGAPGVQRALAGGQAAGAVDVRLTLSPSARRLLRPTGASGRRPPGVR